MRPPASHPRSLNLGSHSMARAISKKLIENSVSEVLLQSWLWLSMKSKRVVGLFSRKQEVSLSLTSIAFRVRWAYLKGQMGTSTCWRLKSRKLARNSFTILKNKGSWWVSSRNWIKEIKTINLGSLRWLWERETAKRVTPLYLSRWRRARTWTWASLHIKALNLSQALWAVFSMKTSKLTLVVSSIKRSHACLFITRLYKNQLVSTLIHLSCSLNSRSVRPLWRSRRVIMLLRLRFLYQLPRSWRGLEQREEKSKQGILTFQTKTLSQSWAPKKKEGSLP